MARGNIAKDNVINKIRLAFGDDFVGIIDKKVYVWADDGGERVQIALAMTCPKAIAEVEEMRSEDTVISQVKEITPEERARINDIMARLNL